MLSKSNLSEKELRLLIKVANMYYIEELSQQQIADKIGVSRTQVSRLLTSAKKHEVVRVVINDPFAKENLVREKLINKYGLKDAVVVNSDGTTISPAMADEIYIMLDYLLVDGDYIAISGGQSVRKICDDIPVIQDKRFPAVALTGGFGYYGNDGYQANYNACVIGNKYHSDSYAINAPTFVYSPTVADALLAEPSIKKTLDLAKKCKAAIVGIGNVGADEPSFTTEPIPKVDVEKLAEEGCVANIVGSFINKDGKIMKGDNIPTAIGFTAEDLRKIPYVIAVSAGLRKTNAIRSVLFGKWINILVTDIKTAEALLQ